MQVLGVAKSKGVVVSEARAKARARPEAASSHTPISNPSTHVLMWTTSRTLNSSESRNSTVMKSAKMVMVMALMSTSSMPTA